MRARRMAVAAVAAAGLAAGAAPALGATATTGVSVNVTGTPQITITAPPSLDFGDVAAGATAASQMGVTVDSTVPAGYVLSASRTAFTNGDLSFDIMSALGPSGTTSTAGVAGNPTAVPVLGGAGGTALELGRRTGTVTGPGGDSWGLSLRLGVPLAASGGSHTSTVTFTALGL